MQPDSGYTRLNDAKTHNNSQISAHEVPCLTLWGTVSDTLRYCVWHSEVPCLTLWGTVSDTLRYRVWHSENLLYQSTLQFMASIASSLCVIVATCVLALITSSKQCGRDFVHANTQLSCVYFWRHTDKMYQAFPDRVSLGTRLPSLNTTASWHYQQKLI